MKVTNQEKKEFKMNLIISIKPQFVEKILSGEKKYEFRRRIYRKEVEKHTCLCLPFVMGEKFSMSYDKKFLSVADKNTIFFNHEVNYCFLDAQLTEEMAAEVTKKIKIQK